MSVEAVILRAAVGDDESYRRIETIANELDALQASGVISPEGLTLIIEAVADEIVAQSVAREVGNDLSPAAPGGDTPETEDPTS